jgi:hypothetical protein
VFYETRTVEHKNGAERPNSTYPDVIANGSQQMENNSSLFNEFVCNLGFF